MNYFLLYTNLIETRKFSSPIKYEKHHIIPKCLGGTNDTENLIKLTPQEHFLAHLFLAKMYPANKKLIHAIGMMSNYKKYSSRKYQWVKLEHAKAMSILHKGRVDSKETILKRKYAVTDATRKKLSESHKGKKITEEHKKIISLTHKGKKISDETKNKIREKLKLYSPTEESNRKRSETLKGRVSPNKGIPSQMKGIPRDPSVLQKAWETRRKNAKDVLCLP